MSGRRYSGYKRRRISYSRPASRRVRPSALYLAKRRSGYRIYKRPENKFFLYRGVGIGENYTGTAVSNGRHQNYWAILQMTPQIAVGPGNSQRLGDEIHLRRLHLKGHWRSEIGGSDLRIIVFTPSTGYDGTGVYEWTDGDINMSPMHVTPNSMLKTLNPGEYTAAVDPTAGTMVHYDKIFRPNPSNAIPHTDGNQGFSQALSIDIKLRQKCSWIGSSDDSASSGYIPKRGHVYVAVMTQVNLDGDAAINGEGQTTTSGGLANPFVRLSGWMCFTE